MAPSCYCTGHTQGLARASRLDVWWPKPLWAECDVIISAKALLTGCQIASLPCEGQREEGAVCTAPQQRFEFGRLASEVAVVCKSATLDALIGHEVGTKVG